jgi:hypothetical protein
LSFIEINAQHVELLPARTVMSLFAMQPIGNDPCAIPGSPGCVNPSGPGGVDVDILGDQGDLGPNGASGRG